MVPLGFLSSASGLGALYGSFGGFTPQGFGSAYTPFGTSPVKKAGGGQVRYAAGGGLAGLPVTRAFSGGISGQRMPSGLPTRQQISERLNRPRSGHNLAHQLFDLLGIGASPAQATSVPLPTNEIIDIENIDIAGSPGPLDYKQREAIRTAEVLYPGFKTADSPTGYNLKDDRIQIGSAGMDADEMYELTAPDRKVLAEIQKVDEDKQALQDLLKAKDAATAAKLTALKGAKESKTKRDQARRETEKNRDLVNILSRFSQNILSTDAGGATIGSAFGKSTLEQDPARQKELDRAGTMAEKLEEIDAAIATAQADGDLQRAQMLIAQRNKMTELNLKRSKFSLDAQKARAELLFKQYDLNIKQTKMLTDVISEVAYKGIANDRPAITNLVTKGFEKYPIEPEKLKEIIDNIMLITSTSAKNPGANRSSRNETASN